MPVGLSEGIELVFQFQCKIGISSLPLFWLYFFFFKCCGCCCYLSACCLFTSPYQHMPSSRLRSTNSSLFWSIIQVKSQKSLVLYQFWGFLSNSEHTTIHGKARYVKKHTQKSQCSWSMLCDDNKWFYSWQNEIYSKTSSQIPKCVLYRARLSISPIVPRRYLVTYQRSAS